MGARVVIVGAGLAGLCCARELARAGVSFRIREASDDVGGRVRTDVADGFRLDRGFQVLLTAYPECRCVLDYGELQLQPFFPGAVVRYQGEFHRIGDPFRAPASAIPTLFAPIGSLADKLRIARFRASLAQYSIADLFARAEVTTRERLAFEGFSAAMIDRFFRPFFGGIFLEPELRTSSRVFDFVFRMLAEGDTVIPQRGMGAIPEQIAHSLPPGCIEFESRVKSIESIDAEAVVIATEGSEARRLLGAEPRSVRGVWCYYFAADDAPATGKDLFLNGDGYGPVNNCCVLTNISPEYSASGRALISATVLESVAEHSPETVRSQLEEWFGPQAARWDFVRRYFIREAQPEQAPPALTPPEREVELGRGLYVCGDHRDHASIHGAMVSGRRAAQQVLHQLNCC